ncbi:MAG: MucBP domain-containing protein, partial [Finegoldia magna]|uniref:MucBP domain-containing protein n=1 Tax=Peptoniphilaceae TaxID=1570339 RepID=UPI002904088E
DLPKEVTDLLPAVQEGKKDGEKVTPTKPSKTEVAVEGGKWVFKDYDKTDKTIDKADENFVGTWVFEENKTPDPETDKGNVYVEYVAEDGTVLDPKSVVKEEAPVGEGYNTELKTFDGYVFARMADDSAPANGDVTKGDQTVTYVYKRIDNPVEEKGNVYVRYITEDGTVLEDYTAVKEDAPVGENYTTEQKTFEGYIFAKIADDSANANGNVVNGDLYVTYVYKPVKTPEVDPEGEKGNVYVNYITVDEEPLANDVVKENAPVGEAYTTEQKAFDGYEFVRMGDGSADANGNVQEGDQYVTYVYKPIEIPQEKTGNVYVKYVDEDRNVIEEETAVKTDAKVGEIYNTTPKDFEDYEFVRMADGSADANGNVVEGDLHVVYVYRKKTTPTPEVVTEFVDENGKTIAPKENGTQPKKDIEGYEFVRTEKDEKGNTKHIYKKVKPTPDVVTEYVDEDGKTIADKENGTQPKKDIKGYEFVRTETDEKGNTKHIYKKKTTTP